MSFSPATSVASADQRDSDDHVLLLAIAAGDREAFGKLFDRHGRSVFAFASSRLPRREDAEEISQDTFLTLWTRRLSVRIVGDSALPWLIVTCRNLAQNRARAIASRDRRLTHVSDDLPANEVSPELAVEQAEFRTRLDAAIRTLSDADQRIFELCLVDGQSYEEAALAAGLTEAAIRNRLSRLRTRLRAELQTLKGTS